MLITLNSILIMINLVLEDSTSNLFSSRNAIIEIDGMIIAIQLVYQILSKSYLAKVFLLVVRRVQTQYQT